MGNLNLREDSAIVLPDGNKYWILKKITLNDFDFYYTIKLGDSVQPVIFADNDGDLQVVENEELIVKINHKLVKNLSK